MLWSPYNEMHFIILLLCDPLFPPRFRILYTYSRQPALPFALVNIFYILPISICCRKQNRYQHIRNDISANNILLSPKRILDWNTLIWLRYVKILPRNKMWCECRILFIKNPPHLWKIWWNFPIPINLKLKGSERVSFLPSLFHCIFLLLCATFTGLDTLNF